MPLPAFSNIPLSGINATMLWSSYMDGTVAIGTPYQVSVPYFYKSDITGEDSNGHNATTLATAFSSTMTWEVQYIIVDPTDVVFSDNRDVDAVFDITLAASTAPGGIGNETIITQLVRSETEWTGSRPQCQIMQNRLQATAFGELYFSVMVKTPSNLVSLLDGSSAITRWMEIIAIKCGVSATDGRFSFIYLIKPGETGITFRAEFDIGTGSTVYNGPYDTAEGYIVADAWYKIECYIKQPTTGGHLNLTDGRFQVVLTRMSTGAREVVADVTGGQLFGASDYPMNRFSFGLCYTGGFPAAGTIELKSSNLEIWDKAPYILV